MKKFIPLKEIPEVSQKELLEVEKLEKDKEKQEKDIGTIHKLRKRKLAIFYRFYPTLLL